MKGIERRIHAARMKIQDLTSFAESGDDDASHIPCWRRHMKTGVQGPLHFIATKMLLHVHDLVFSW
jgi:hypothetical protein